MRRISLTIERSRLLETFYSNQCFWNSRGKHHKEKQIKIKQYASRTLNDDKIKYGTKKKPWQ